MQLEVEVEPFVRGVGFVRIRYLGKQIAKIELQPPRESPGGVEREVEELAAQVSKAKGSSVQAITNSL